MHKHTLAMYRHFYLLIAALLLFLTTAPHLNLGFFGDSDPFSYLHQSYLQPLFKPWIANQNRSTLSFLDAVTIRPEAKAAYDFQVLQDSKVKSNLSDGISTQLNFPLTGCETIRMDRPGKTAIVASTDNPLLFTSISCDYEITDAQISDDTTLLAIQLDHRSDEYDKRVYVFQIIENSLKLRGRIKTAKLAGKSSFLKTGALIYLPLRTHWSLLSACALRSWSDKDECLIENRDLPKGLHIEKVFRATAAESTWLLLAPEHTDYGTVYKLESNNRSFKLSSTTINDLSKLVPTENGFFFVRQKRHSKEMESIQIFSFSEPSPHLQEIATVESSRIRWSRGHACVYVWFYDDSSKNNRLIRIAENKKTEIQLESALASSVDAELARGSGKNNVKIRLSDGLGSYTFGDILTNGDFREEISVEYPLPVELIRFTGVSQDGTTVPCTLVRKQNTNSAIPAVLKVYGAYGAILRPSVGAQAALVLSHGIGYVFAHARGGGELGKAWAAAGKARNKINTILDTEACMQSGIQKNYLISGQIVLSGSSAGAIPAMLTALRNPQTTTGAWLDVPFFDSAGRAQNDAKDDYEFGDVANPTEALTRKNLSPYHQLLKASENTGKFLFTCGAEDVRTPSWQCLKAHAVVKKFHPKMESHFFIFDNEGHLSYLLGANKTKERDFLIAKFILKSLEGSASKSR